MMILDLLHKKDLLICVGSGGVGKTTTAASIALRAAREGRRVLVLTIDPARRLANSLGMKRFGNSETRIEVPGAKGELWAMMLDNTRTFNDLIEKLAPSPAARDRILKNQIYRAIAGSVSGSQDYMATEKLYDVVEGGLYDLVVLDTPPVKNALDFLEAPGRLARFLDKRIMKWFLTPYDEGRVFGKLLMGTSAVVFRLLAYIFGREFLSELSEFFMAFRDLYDGFRERHETVVRLFHSNRTAFMVVCAPNDPSVEVAQYFVDELRQRKMPNPGVIVNQRHLTLGQVISPEEIIGGLARDHSEDLASHTASALVARLGAAHRRLRELSAIEESILTSLVGVIDAKQQIWSIPRLEEDVHDIESLDRVGFHLFGQQDQKKSTA